MPEADPAIARRGGRGLGRRFFARISRGVRGHVPPKKIKSEASNDAF